MGGNDYKKLGLDKIDLQKVSLPNMDAINNQFNSLEKSMNEINAEKARKEQEEIQRQKELNEHTKQIAENTSFIPEMVGLIRENNQVNTEMLEFHKEMLDVMKADTEEEARNKVNEIAEKARNTNENITAVVSLYKFGETIVKSIFGG